MVSCASVYLNMSFDETSISGSAATSCASNACARGADAPSAERQLALAAMPGAGIPSVAAAAPAVSSNADGTSMTWLTPSLGAAAATATQLYASWQIYTGKAGVAALLAIGVQSLLVWGIVFTMGTGSSAEAWVAIGALAFGIAYIAYSVWAMARV